MFRLPIWVFESLGLEAQSLTTLALLCNTWFNMRSTEPALVSHYLSQTLVRGVAMVRVTFVCVDWLLLGDSLSASLSSLHWQFYPSDLAGSGQYILNVFRHAMRTQVWCIKEKWDVKQLMDFCIAGKTMLHLQCNGQQYISRSCVWLCILFYNVL